MDESNLRGLRTRKALRDFTLMPSICRTANNEENKPIITMVKSRIFQVFLRYEFWCVMKPYAMIFIAHSLVKIMVNIISISSRNSLMAVESPFGMGWKTARQRQVPMMAIRMKASNDFHSTTSSNFFLIGFLSPIHQRAYGSLSMGGLAPTLLAVFFTSAGGSPLATGGSPLGWPGSFPVPLC